MQSLELQRPPPARWGNLRIGMRGALRRQREATGIICCDASTKSTDSTLQHTAPYCNALQHTALFVVCGGRVAACGKVGHLQRCEHTVNTQHTAPLCAALQHVATHCNCGVWGVLRRQRVVRSAICDILQHSIPHCNVLQHAATHCSILQHTATRCNTRQHTATHLTASAEERHLKLTASYCNTLNSECREASSATMQAPN